MLFKFLLFSLSYTFQSLWCWSLINIVIVDMMVLLAHSTIPFLCGCCVEFKAWIPSSWQYFLNWQEVKHVSLLLTVLSGNPNSSIKFLRAFKNMLELSILDWIQSCESDKVINSRSWFPREWLYSCLNRM